MNDSAPTRRSLLSSSFSGAPSIMSSIGSTAQDDPVRQFLVADEVGLGKTMVARGVIARMIEHLWDSTERIDILYICSNQAIAAQNLNRLNVLGRRELALPTRMTLDSSTIARPGGPRRQQGQLHQPDARHDLRSALRDGRDAGTRPVAAISCATSFRARGACTTCCRSPPASTAGTAPWTISTLEGVDKRIIERFRRDVQADRDLFEELERVCELFPRRRDVYPPEMTQPRNSLVARLRAKLSHACVDALQPDLIIMDEFQRFRDLLHGDSDAAILARELFDYSGGDGHAARTLLLSATPYRMLTLAGDEPDEGDHYQDFLETLSFLYGREKGPEVAATLAREMRAFRGLLHALPQSHASAVEARQAIEQRLRKVIVANRAGRVSTVERDSMMSEPAITVSVAPADLAQASAAVACGAHARCAGDHRILEVRALPAQLHAPLQPEAASDGAGGGALGDPPRALSRRLGRPCSITTPSTPMRRWSRPMAACARSWTTSSASASNRISGYRPPCPTTAPRDRGRR